VDSARSKASLLFRWLQDAPTPEIRTTACRPPRRSTRNPPRRPTAHAGAVPVGDRPHDRQPQPAARGLRGAGGAVEAVEHAVAFLLRHAGAAVLHDQGRPLCIGSMPMSTRPPSGAYLTAFSSRLRSSTSKASAGRAPRPRRTRPGRGRCAFLRGAAPPRPRASRASCCRSTGVAGCRRIAGLVPGQHQHLARPAGSRARCRFPAAAPRRRGGLVVRAMQACACSFSAASGERSSCAASATKCAAPRTPGAPARTAG
jgi:hypothetical protein